MWPYGSFEPPLGQEAPTYADGLEAHWRALPLRRKFHILLYLVGRLFRYAPRAMAADVAARAEDFRATLRRWGQGVAYAAATLRWAITPEGRCAIADFIESLVTFRTAREAAPFVALMILLIMLSGLDRNSDQNSAGDNSIVEAARRAHHFRPPPCYLVDGEVWIDAEGGPLRPGRRNYRERRQEICGF